MSNLLTNSFVEKCVRGEVLPNEVDDYVDTWHNSDSEFSLREFLGMTIKEYNLWIKDSSVLPYIVSAHKFHVDVENLIHEESLPLAARASHSKNAGKVVAWLKKTGRVK